MQSYLIIGAGRVGRALHHCLNGSTLLASRAGDVELFMNKMTPDTVVLLCCRDNAIDEQVAWLKATNVRMRAIIHFTGSISHEVLSPLVGRSLGMARAHPCRIISEQATKNVFAKGVFHVTGNERGIQAVHELARLLSMTVLMDEVTNFALYHCALYFIVAENAVSETAKCIARAAGISENHLMLLSRSILYSEFQAEKPTTVGPVARGDVVTIERHLSALRQYVPGCVEKYKEIFRIPTHL
jgi:predicted short-subunit dehydrogenase-like oxidoreductase (DUF2520 family)